MVAAACILVWEMGYAVQPNGDFSRSYWLVTYDHGFFRRGLAGEIAQATNLGSLSTSVDFWVQATAWIPTLIVVGIALLLLMRPSSPGHWGVALLLLASPYTVELFWTFRKPDQLGFLALPLVSWLYSRRRWIGWAAICGLILAGLILIHEGIALTSLPWAFVISLSLLSRWERGGRALHLALTYAPAVVVGILIAIVKPTEAALAGVTSDIDRALGAGSHTLTPFLRDDLFQSVALVRGLGMVNMMLMIVLGFGLALMHAAVWWIAGLPWPSVLTKPMTAVATAVPLLSLGLQALIGYDWFRWHGMWGCGLLITLALLLLAEPAWAISRTPRILPLCIGCAVLAIIPPISWVVRWPDITSYWNWQQLLPPAFR